jgi:hypothetical protein
VLYKADRVPRTLVLACCLGNVNNGLAGLKFMNRKNVKTYVSLRKVRRRQLRKFISRNV